MPSAVHDRDVPQDLDAERAVLGALLIAPEMLTAVAALLQPGDFFRAAHEQIYAACLALSERGEPCDFTLLCAELTRRQQLGAVGGPQALVELMNCAGLASNGPHYAGVVAEKALRRRLIQAGAAIATQGYAAKTADEAVDAAERLVLGLGGRTRQAQWVSLGDSLSAFLDEADAYAERQGEVLGVPTGFGELDRLTGGLQRTDLVIVAGRPGSGKTSWAVNVATTAALGGIPAAIFSVEMSRGQLVQRIVCATAGVDSQALRRGRLGDDEWAGVNDAVARLGSVPLWIDDTPALPLLELRSKARRIRQERGIGVFFVDYLQLVHGTRRENRVQEVTEITQSLKALARELEVPVVALSQLNRSVEGRPGHRPQLSDLRESGSLEQEADLVLFVHREELYEPETPRKGIADLIVAKHRKGPIGDIELQFTPGCTRFGDLEQRYSGPGSQQR